MFGKGIIGNVGRGFLRMKSIVRVLKVSESTTCGLVERVGDRLRGGNCVIVHKGMDEGCFRRHVCNVDSTMWTASGGVGTRTNTRTVQLERLLLRVREEE